MALRNVPLAERRAEAAALDEALKVRRQTCVACGGRARSRAACADRDAMAKELAGLREEIKHWFDPGPDQEALF